MSETVTARLIKRETKNGLWKIEDHVPIGKKYRVDPSSIRIISAFNKEKEILHDAEMIWSYTPPPGWFPTELLDIPGEEAVEI
jgi:hypothetical protein